MDNNRLVPVEQAVLPFHGSVIFAFRLSDGRIVASLSSLCKMLKLAKHGQVERIKRDENLARHLLVLSVQTPNGSQRVDSLVASAIRLWVMGIQVNLIAQEKRPLVNLLKENAYEMLSRALFKPETEQSVYPPSEVQEEPEALPPPPGSRSSTTSDSHWERLFEVLHEMQQHEERKDKHLAQRFAGIEEWLTSLDRRVAATGQASAAEPGWLPGLSQSHLADLRMLLRSLEQATGCAALQLEQEVVETFGTPTINTIPDEQWQDVLAWGLWRAQQPR